MPISVGDTLPEATFFRMTGDGPEQVSSADIFKGKKVAAFAVPGAYTPTCHLKHMPGFLAHTNEFKEKGVDEIVCIAMNDPFVLQAWEKETDATGRVTILGDSDASFTKTIGMDFDAAAVGLGVRSKRYAMIVDDGRVSVLNVEDVPSEAEASSAETLLKAL